MSIMSIISGTLIILWLASIAVGGLILGSLLVAALEEVAKLNERTRR